MDESHIAKYVNRNSKLFPVYVGEEYDIPMNAYPKDNRHIEGFAIDNADGKYIIAVINPNTDKRQIQFEFGGLSWYAELSPESIGTIIIEP